MHSGDRTAKGFECRVCNTSFSSASELSMHNAKAHGRFACEACGGMRFGSEAELSRHMKSAHSM